MLTHRWGLVGTHLVGLGLSAHFQPLLLDFSLNLGAVKDEQGKRFHQNIQAMEAGNKGLRDKRMMGDYC